jgi:hypothetical protein
MWQLAHGMMFMVMLELYQPLLKLIDGMKYDLRSTSMMGTARYVVC